MEPLTRNLYTYAENNPVNFNDPSSHGILSWAKKAVSSAKNVISKAKTAVSKAVTTVKNAASKAWNTVKTAVSSGYNKVKNWASSTSGSSRNSNRSSTSSGSGTGSGGSSGGSSSKNIFERAKDAGRSLWNWSNSKIKEAQNVSTSWSKALEKTIIKFCTTANRISAQTLTTNEIATNRIKQLPMIENATVMKEMTAVSSVAINPAEYSGIYELIAVAAESLWAMIVANPFVALVGGLIIVAIGGTIYYVNKNSIERETTEEKTKEKTGIDTWGNPDTLDDHYERHGDEVGAEDAEDYAEKAHEFYENRDDYQVKVDKNGTVRVYDPETNTFGSYNSDGSTRTYYKPKGGQDYFDRQPGM